MAVATFELLLAALVLIPTGFGLYALGPEPEVLIPSLSAVLALFIHLSGKGKKLRPLRRLFWPAVGLYALWALFNFSLENLPALLFGLAELLLAFVLLWDESFKKYLYAVLLGFLNLAAVSLYYQGLVYGVFLLLYLFLVLFFFLLLGAEAYKGNLPKRATFHLLRYAAVTYALVLAAAAVLFFVLPRPVQPVFTLVKKEKPVPAVGFSDEVRLGRFSEVAQDPSVVFRAKVEPPAKGPYYWRGTALERFDGRVWRPGNGRYASSTFKGGRTRRVSLLLEPYGGKVVFSLPYPVKVVDSTAEGVRIDFVKNAALLEKPLGEPAKVVLQTAPESAFEVKLLNEKLLLEVPESLKPLLEELVEKERLRGKNFYEVRERLKRFFAGFGYSETNEAKNLAEFLTVYREGNCEYFASAAALLFRILGYPSRVAVGFLGGEVNPLTGYLVVRQKDAHAWTEVFYAGRWHRFDATRYAAVPPSREGVKTTTFEKNRLAALLDAVETLWLEYFVNLNREKQFKLLRKSKEFLTDLKEELKERAPLLGALGLLLLVAVGVKRRRLLAFWLFKLLLRFKERFGARAETPAELYSELWRERPELFRRYKRLLKKLLGAPQ
ncbi:MAG: DUF3488 domain-containing protein [Aquificae bacterium]|nr:DUF3488 domain-containing protein [Aquificota bacterium]